MRPSSILWRRRRRHQRNLPAVHRTGRPYRCSALLLMRLAVPRPSPDARWALTPPFHPYRIASSPYGSSAISRERRRRSRVARRYTFCCAICHRGLHRSRRTNKNRSARALPGIMPYGARTFLDRSCVATPPRQPNPPPKNYSSKSISPFSSPPSSLSSSSYSSSSSPSRSSRSERLPASSSSKKSCSPCSAS
jgi:hypothetical protein